VQTLTFKTLYVLVFIAHGRRELVHINVTANPTAAWVWRQLIEATPWGQQPRHLLRDHDAVYGRDFRPRARRIGIDAIATPVASARASAIVERVIGTLGSRRGCLGCLPWRFFWRRVHDEHRCRTSPVDKSRIRRRFNSRSGHEHSVRTRCRRRTVCGLGRVAAGRQEHVLPRREVSGDSGRKDGASQLVRVGPLLATIPSLLQPTSASTCIVRHAHGSVQPKLSCQRWTHVTCTNRSARQPARHHRATLPPVLPLRSRTRRCRSRSPS
jgi:hypothetical protein